MSAHAVRTSGTATATIDAPNELFVEDRGLASALHHGS